MKKCNIIKWFKFKNEHCWIIKAIKFSNRILNFDVRKRSAKKSCDLFSEYTFFSVQRIKATVEQ